MDDFVSRGGVVYGARLDEGSRVVHSRAVTRDDILSFRTSKYAQSDPGDTFSRVSDDLSAGREVLFTGTPCQTAALRDLTGGAEGLYLADVFCHGVAAPAIWAAYLSREEAFQGQTVSSALFRDPSFGWSDSVCTVSFADGSRRSSREWARMYRKNLMVRPSCTRCPYACVNRPSDVSLGDCWGIGRSHPAFADGDRGCSLVLVHTSRGEALSESLSRSMERVPVPLKDFLQPSLCGPVQAVGEASAFERDFLSRGYAYARRRHVVPSLAERWRMLKWKVKCFLKRKGIWK